MISAVSGSSSYTGIQRYTQVKQQAPVRENAAAAAEKSSVIAAQKHSSIGTPVQPVDAAKKVNPGASGNLNVEFSARSSADAAEMAVRMRISPAQGEETTQAAQETANPLSGEEKTEQQERLQAQQEAEAKREAYLEALQEEKEARAERIEALKEAQQTEEKPETEDAQAEGEEETQPGAIQFDRTAALLQNAQMTNLLQNMLTSRADGKSTENHSKAIDALLNNEQNRLHFVTEDSKNSDERNRYQQSVSNYHRYSSQSLSASSSLFGATA